MKKLGLFLLVLLILIGAIPQTAFAAGSTTFDQELTAYLEEVSAARGFEVSIDNINQSLASYGMTTKDFSSVDEMKSFLGDVIQSDLSNLSSVYEDYGMDQTALTQKLSEYGENLNDYVYVYDLDYAMSMYTSKEDSVPTIDKTMIIELLKQFDLSDPEIQNLKDYYTSIQDYLNSDEVASQMLDLRNRMTALTQTLLAEQAEDSAYKPTETEINQMSTMYDELFSILKVKANFYLVNNGVSTPVTIAELMKMKDVGKADVKAVLYTSDSVLLADMVVPNDMIQSKLEEGIKAVSDSSDTSSQTEKGGALPKTASDYLTDSLIGLVVALAGISIYLKLRKDTSEIYKEQA